MIDEHCGVQQDVKTICLLLEDQWHTQLGRGVAPSQRSRRKRAGPRWGLGNDGEHLAGRGLIFEGLCSSWSVPATSSNSRVFSMAMTALVGEGLSRVICPSVNGCTVLRCQRDHANRCSFPHQWHAQ